MNKKIAILCLIGIFALSLMLPVVTAKPSPKPAAVGAGAFVMEHEDGLHKHFFSFSVSDPTNPKGTLTLVCFHENGTLCMIVQSKQILTFNVQCVPGGLSATFTGTAKVKMHGEGWTDGWTFTATALDLSKVGKGNDIFILDLTNAETHHMEGTLTAGNIIIHK